MKVGILGSGPVGQAMAKGLINEGHSVWLATRHTDDEKAQALQMEITNATVCDFATAARQGDYVILCVKWDGVQQAIDLAGAQNLRGKLVIDASNIITMEGDNLAYGGDNKQSAGELVQQWLPDSRVVKAFNTVGAAMMYQPDFGNDKPTMFIAGDNLQAKQQVRDLCIEFGWDPLDAGGIIASRSLEAMAVTWINNAQATGTPHHAFKML